MPIATPEQIKAATDALLKRHMSEDGLTLKLEVNDDFGQGSGHLVSALLENEWREREAYGKLANVRYVG